MKNILVVLITVFAFSCNRANIGPNPLLVNANQISVDSVIKQAVYKESTTHNRILKDDILRKLTSDVDSIYRSNNHLFKDLYGVVEDVAVYRHLIKGVEYSKLTARIVDRTNKDFEVRYVINRFVESSKTGEDSVFNVLRLAQDRSKVYISGMFSKTDNGIIDFESNAFKYFNIKCEFINSIRVINTNTY